MQTLRSPVHLIEGSLRSTQTETLPCEEPLEIRLCWEDSAKTVSITMRTPGHDRELALGFLFSEGIIRDPGDIENIQFCGPVMTGDDSSSSFRNVIKIKIKPGLARELHRLDRHFYTSSSCGVCGKTSIEALKIQRSFATQETGPIFKAEQIHRFSEILRASQSVFEQTGGLHSCGLFDMQGSLIISFEDVGRHNALDKLIGHAWAQNWLPLHSHFLLLSGRVSFELVQKASMCGISIVGAIGAPSSLALKLAQEVNMTLLGFIRNDRFNIYHAPWRVQ